MKANPECFIHQNTVCCGAFMQQIASENRDVLLLALLDSAEMELTDNGTNEIQKYECHPEPRD